MTILDAPAEAGQHRLGLLLVFCSAVAWSSAGFFVRLVALDSWTILVWRGLFGALFIAAFILIRGRGRSPGFGAVLNRPALMVVVCSATGMISFIPALSFASVAEVSIVYATAPFVAAGIAFWWLRERPTRSTMTASLVALGGIAVTVAGAPFGLHLVGDLLAFIMTLTIAATMCVMRRYRAIEMLPAAALSSLVAGVVSMPFSHWTAIDGRDLAYLALFGVIQMGLGFLLFTLGARLLAPAENALIGALDAPLAPFWVWLAFAEVPSAAALIGGLIVLGAVATHLAVSHRSAG